MNDVRTQLYNTWTLHCVWSHIRYWMCAWWKWVGLICCKFSSNFEYRQCIINVCDEGARMPTTKEPFWFCVNMWMVWMVWRGMIFFVQTMWSNDIECERQFSSHEWSTLNGSTNIYVELVTIENVQMTIYIYTDADSICVYDHLLTCIHLTNCIKFKRTHCKQIDSCFGHINRR